MTATLPSDCRLIPLAVKGDDRGSLIAIEGGSDLPFAIARVHYIHAPTPGAVLGQYARRAADQVAVSVAGSCTMLLDDGHARVEVRLDDPAAALTLPPMVWHEMRDFTADCVLMILASEADDEADTIRDYAEFKALARP